MNTGGTACGICWVFNLVSVYVFTIFFMKKQPPDKIDACVWLVLYGWFYICSKKTEKLALDFDLFPFFQWKASGLAYLSGHRDF
jgi:hypothetical protein